MCWHATLLAVGWEAGVEVRWRSCGEWNLNLVYVSYSPYEAQMQVKVGERTHCESLPACEMVIMILSEKYMLETPVSTPPTVPDSFLVFAGKCSRSTCGAREISSISLASPSTTGAATAGGAI